MTGKLWIMLAVQFLLWSPLASADEYRVNRSQLNCVRDNIDNYLKTNGDVITIVLPACPIADPLEAYRSLAKNNAFKREDRDQSKLDAIIKIKRTELTCVLKSIDGTIGDPIVISTDKKCVN